MTESRAAALPGDVSLLERAISYTLGNLREVTSAALTRPTPCRDWDLHALLEHMNDSLAALQEVSDLGHVFLGPVPWHDDPAANLTAVLRARACRLLGAWVRGAGPGPDGEQDTAPDTAPDTASDTAPDTGPGTVSVGGLPAPIGLVAWAGAVEVAVHGWDVGQACGCLRPIPPQLAAELLWLVPQIVTDADRPERFAEPVPVPAGASAGDHLVAFLGREPRR
jgi:uncharacterized protein (TIGR03083 family)